MVKPSREPSRIGVDCGMPLIANSGERPRRVSPLPDSFWRVGENDGDSDDTASTIEPLIATCCDKVVESITSTVIGKALAGSVVRAAVITSSDTSVGPESCAWAAPAMLRASRLAPATNRLPRAIRAPPKFVMQSPTRILIEARSIAATATYSQQTYAGNVRTSCRGAQPENQPPSTQLT